MQAVHAYRDRRAAAESGWDFSSRWLADGITLSTVRTTEIVPIDLNCLLYLSERRIAAELIALGAESDGEAFALAATTRAATIERLLWNDKDGHYADWLWTKSEQTAGITAATVARLYARLAAPSRGARVAETIQHRLLAPGGLRTTTVASGQQWDAPNGWAPLQWLAVQGLRNYGEDALADEISRRWIGSVELAYSNSGTLFEKYDVETGHQAGGGEYTNQVGFGWTNGLLKALLADGPDADPHETIRDPEHVPFGCRSA